VRGRRPRHRARLRPAPRRRQRKLTTAFAKVGFSGDFGITWPLVRTLGSAKALELLLLSDVLSAADALQLGC
jgi:enoyl-CoA hydratase/carnithine racemase